MFGRSLATFSAAVAGCALVLHAGPDPTAQGMVTVTGVSVNHSSVKVYFNPVPGAQDYRIYDAAAPDRVKYAGQMRIVAGGACPGSSCQHHFVMQSDGVTPVFPYQRASGATGGPQALDVPATSIEWNDVGDFNQHTLIVEAVDRLGPVPRSSLYQGHLTTPLEPGGMLGSNKGPTADGKISTNGQGPYTNVPQVIARSRPFIVRADSNLKTLPSRAAATQTFYDTFETAQNATFRQTFRNDTLVDAYGNLGVMKFTLGAGTARAWDIDYRQADNLNSMPFISADHFMDMLFDGATPGTSASSHTIFSSMSMSPARTFDLSDGKILHLTMEVDSHWSFRRWIAFNLAPASDPLQHWDPGPNGLNTANQAVFLEIKDAGCTFDIYTGSTSSGDRTPTGSAGGASGARLWGQWVPFWCSTEEMFVGSEFSKNGLGHDDRSRLDFFISSSHAAFFQDGKLIVQSPIPAGSFPYANVPMRAYFTHYLYHSINDVDELKTFSVSGQNFCYPMNSYWFNNPMTGTAPGDTICNRAYPAGYGFPHSDERHWDNMGAEVLPAGTVPANDFSSFLSAVQPPARQAPVFSGTMTPPAAPSNLRIIGTLGAMIRNLFGPARTDAPAAVTAPAPAAHTGHGAHH